MTPRPADEALAELGAVAAELAAHVEAADALYERRSALFVELRAATPPVTYAAIAKAADTTEGAVLMACRKRYSRAAG